MNEQPTYMLEWTHKHVPVSVSICGNVEGFTDSISNIEHDQDTLIERVVRILTDIANTANELAENKWLGYYRPSTRCREQLMWTQKIYMILKNPKSMGMTKKYRQNTALFMENICSM